MKKFFLSVLSSFVGAWLAIVLSGVVVVIILISLIGISMSSENVGLEEGSVLKIDLSGVISERNVAPEFDVSMLTSGEISMSQSLETLTNAIKEAKENSNVKAIYVECGSVEAAPATINAIKQSLEDFKSSGKKVYAYADEMTQGAYYIVCNADKIFLNPEGAVSLKGLGGYTPYFKELLDKLGISFQVVKVGEGKSAVEPYILSSMSQYARDKHAHMYNELWDIIKSDLAKANDVTPAKIDSLINIEHIAFSPAKVALEQKLVDALYYRHEVEEEISKDLGQTGRLEKTTSPTVLSDIRNTNEMMKGYSDQIAVLYAVGGIDDGSNQGIVSEDLVKEILRLADDESVKGLVLRVNSPGGSAFGSEQIWEALEVFKKSNKPYAVSMGDYAASGGYYISAGADKIFADPLTITGSIGIFGLIPNVEDLLRSKLGVNMELVATNPDAVYPSGVKPMTDQQLAVMQNMVERGYELFVKRCAEGRNKSIDEIKALADGSAIAATDAKKLGLIDEFGSIDDAVKWVAEKAKLNSYAVCDYPKVPISVFDYLSMFSEDSMTKLIYSDKFDLMESKIVEMFRNMLDNNVIYAKMPEIIVEM